MMEILGRRARREGSTKAAEDRKSKNRSLELTSNFQISSSWKRLIGIIEFWFPWNTWGTLSRLISPSEPLSVLLLYNLLFQFCPNWRANCDCNWATSPVGLKIPPPEKEPTGIWASDHSFLRNASQATNMSKAVPRNSGRKHNGRKSSSYIPIVWSLNWKLF